MSLETWNILVAGLSFACMLECELIFGILWLQALRCHAVVSTVATGMFGVSPISLAR